MSIDGKTILPTGGTGSFGTALADRARTAHPTTMVRIFSRGELKQSRMRAEFGDDQFRYFVGDIRDQPRLARATQDADLIIHAVAMKQVPACEYNPSEVVATNVDGGQSIVDAAIDAGVAQAVAFSTDNAVNPVNLHGLPNPAPRRSPCRATPTPPRARPACRAWPTGISGSRGSVVPLFWEQLTQGLLTITDTRMTRFWVTLPQAVDLVLFAVEHAEGGEVFVPKRPSTRVTDLAEVIAPGVPIDIIGIRAGEKLHEQMLTTDESRHAVAIDDVHVVLPEHPWWSSPTRWSEGKPLPLGLRLCEQHQRPVARTRRDRRPAAVIPYGSQRLDENDIAAVVQVLRGEWLTTGPAVAAVAEAVRHATSARHAVAFSSGTAASHGATAARLGPGDTVYTSPLSFVASANCARFVGADAAFLDIDPTTLNMDLTGVPTDADVVVAVHYAGLPVDLTALRVRPRVVIEDAAHALGAATPDGPVGSCAHSDMCAFSFHPVKVVTSGEGGAVTTNSGELAERLRLFRNHEMVRRPERGGWV